MKTCCKKYNKGKDYSKSIKSKSFICSNCFNKQLIENDFIFVGYCNSSNKSGVHSDCYDSSCYKLIDNDEISFVCSYENFSKISFNNLNGKPKYNVVQLDKKEIEILGILLRENKEDLYTLMKEYFFSLILNHNSSATLLARKMLMHFAFELGCTEKNKDFVYYVNYIRNDGTLSKNWNHNLNIIRTLGNDENHKLKVATNKELKTIKIIMEQLINSHFLPQIYK